MSWRTKDLAARRASTGLRCAYASCPGSLRSMALHARWPDLNLNFEPERHAGRQATKMLNEEIAGLVGGLRSTSGSWLA